MKLIQFSNISQLMLSTLCNTGSLYRKFHFPLSRQLLNPFCEKSTGNSVFIIFYCGSRIFLTDEHPVYGYYTMFLEKLIIILVMLVSGWTSARLYAYAYNLNRTVASLHRRTKEYGIWDK